MDKNDEIIRNMFKKKAALGTGGALALFGGAGKAVDADNKAGKLFSELIQNINEGGTKEPYSWFEEITSDAPICREANGVRIGNLSIGNEILSNSKAMSMFPKELVDRIKAEFEKELSNNILNLRKDAES
jgi:hypothetical protein